MSETKRKRNFLKPLIIGALAVVVTGGVGAYAYDKYEEGQRAKIQEAYSNVKMNVGNQTAQNNGVSLYVYKVEAKANGLEYDVVVDAISGKVLKVKIDD